jgi:ribosome recycling factor
MIADVKKSADQKMQKTVEALKTDLGKVRTGRAHTGLLDHIMVDYYGTPTALKQVANLTLPDARTIAVTPYEKRMAPVIAKAIRDSDLGLNPSTTGEMVRVPMPALTEERRKELVKQVKKTAEEHKIGVREARRSGLVMLKDLEAEGDVTADDRRRVEKQIQDLTDSYVGKIDEAISRKEAEILEV